MRAISLWQPWASLWCSPLKIHETRHWATKHRGWLAVHAAKHFEKDFPPVFADMLRQQFGASWFNDLPAGAVIGKVNLLDCLPTEHVYPDGALRSFEEERDHRCGDFDSGRFAWKRGEFMLLHEPVPFRGLQAIFNVPDEIFQ